MRAPFIALTVLAFIGVSGQSFAAPAEAPKAATVAAPAATTDPLPDDQKIICKSEAVTGTRFATRQCHTKATWAQMTADARAFTDASTKAPCMAGCSGH